MIPSLHVHFPNLFQPNTSYCSYGHRFPVVVPNPIVGIIERHDKSLSVSVNYFLALVARLLNNVFLQYVYST